MINIFSSVFLVNLCVTFFFTSKYYAEEAFLNLEFEFPIGIYHPGDDSVMLFVIE
jgi:hypothetical protein